MATRKSLAPIAATGTTTINREVVGDEYVSALQDLPSRMRTYTKMRRGDGAVHTALMALEKPILGARWDVAGNDDVAQACREELFSADRGAAHDPSLFEQVLTHLLTYLQYGFAAAEPVWALGDDQRIHCSALTIIRQESVRTFRLKAGTGELEHLVQYTQALDESVRDIDVPAERLMLAVHAREGADYSGVSLIRPCYRAWLERDTIRKTRLWHHDRFGAGTPVAEYPQGAGDDDKDAVDEALADFRAGARTYLAVPHGTKLQLIGGQNTGTGPTEELAALAAEIAKTTLSQVTELGTSGNGGNRALGNTFATLLRAGLQGYAEYLAKVIRRGIVQPFVRWNFGESTPIPELTVSVTLTGVLELLEAITAAVAAGLHLEPEDIAALRDELELPEIPLEELKQRLEARKAEAADLAAAKARQVPAPGQKGAPPKGDPESKPTTLADPAEDRALDYRGRPRGARVVALEEQILKPRGLGEQLDREAVRAGADVLDELRAIDRVLVDQVRTLAAAGGDALTARVQSIDVPKSNLTRLQAALARAAERAQQVGFEAVLAELERQGLDTTQPTPRLFTDRLRSALRRLLADDSLWGGLAAMLRALVGLYASREAAQRATAAQAAALQAVTAAAPQAAAAGAAAVDATAVAQRVADTLAERAAAAVEARVSEVVNVAFGQGRQQAAQAFGRAIERQVRSEALDAHTCEHCARHDGDDYAFGDPMAPELPDPNCAGGMRCRGVWMYLLAADAPRRAA
ncbi:phage portal protein family protein [Roseisolibacter agri]|uniref:Uncharacterized protein n=1 Tax=Roseisolibacter agri TaxID=2014610 RepID=A0AA37Q2A7_9BACT|nr:DUF935 family protein [Roseisolibacter agri]GLC25074.1 hypothetical protein rosag_15870 [Roseisolibacter agri]